MSDFTNNNNILKAPSGVTDIASVLNGFIDKYETGRTIKLTSGEAITALRAVTLTASGIMHAKATDTFLGISAMSCASGADVYVFCDKGIEINVAGAAFAIGGNVYVGIDGVITQTDGGYGKIGIAIKASSIVLL